MPRMNPIFVAGLFALSVCVGAPALGADKKPNSKPTDKKATDSKPVEKPSEKPVEPVVAAPAPKPVAKPARVLPPPMPTRELAAAIDKFIAAGLPDYDKRKAAPASDAEFLRRATLDLVGTLPTSAEVRTFLADQSPDKRDKLIDRLLAAPEFDRHMAAQFDVIWMERRGDKHVPKAAWLEYLRSNFAAKKPLDALVGEILSADGSDPAARAPAKFYLEREGEPHLITRDVGRLFLGMNLTCAQCHNHPLIGPYKQAHYYGIFSFYNRTTLVTDKAKKSSVLSEAADGEVSFQSVFNTKVAPRSITPRLPGGEAIEEPKFEKGKEYKVKPAKDTRAVPEFSRRSQLAGRLLDPEYPQFRRAMANRLWALMMGRGIVHPVEYDNEDNPPTHPELLDLLSNELANSKFDLRTILRAVAYSNTYRLSSELPTGSKDVADDGSYLAAPLRALSPEPFAMSLMQATGLADSERGAMGPKATEPAMYAKLSPNLAPFANTFGSAAGTPQEFDVTVEQTLFITNGPLVRGWLAPRPGNLVDRLVKLATPETAAEELYLSVLGRPPAPDEVRETAEFVKTREKDKPAAWAELAWGLLASAEFRFNH